MLFALFSALSLTAPVSPTPLLVGPAAQTGPPPGYYDTVDDTDATTLRTTLHPVVDDHTRFPYTSGSTDTWNILEMADEDPGNSSNILDVYRNASYTKQGGGNAFYQREHTWPNSYGFPNDGSSNYPFTDCHQLFLCDGSYNGSRSNKPFRNCNSGCAEFVTDVNNGTGGGSGIYPGNSNWSTGSFTNGTWEIWPGRRGDVARAMFYMDIRYEGGTHGVTGFTEPDLRLTDDQSLIAASNTGSNESVAYMGMLTVLLQWHMEDPVDALEMARNDAVACFQGNRNPFIDHPEWVDVLYDTPPVVAGGDLFINEFHYDNSGGDVGEFIEVAGPSGTNLAGWTLYGYNGSGGAVYNTVALSGVLPDGPGCMGTLSFAFTGLQNGAPDGMALVDPSNQVVEFLSYEGDFIAVGGPANGMMSVDVGVSESSSTAIGTSLQRGGTGSGPADFFWQASLTETPGAVNANQTLAGGLVAAVDTRNAGTNPASYTASTIVIGGSFTATVDNGLAGQLSSALFAFDSTIELLLGGGQTVLAIDLSGAGEFFTGAGLFPTGSTGSVDDYALPVPPDPALCGLVLHSQAVQFGTPPFTLSNAQDLTVGY